MTARSREWDADSNTINKVASINKTIYGCTENFTDGEMFNVQSEERADVNMQMAIKKYISNLQMGAHMSRV